MPTNLTSVGAIQAAITAAVPIALAGLGGLWSERAGVVNIGLEGMMVLGTFGCGFIGYQWGPWAGVVAGILCGLLGGLLLALSTVTFGVDHIIAGVAISIVAPGLALFVAQLKFGGQQSPPVADVFRITIPGLSDWLGTIADKGWFLISDIAGVLGGLTTQLSAAERDRRRADRRLRMDPLADPVRAAPAVRAARRPMPPSRWA